MPVFTSSPFLFAQSTNLEKESHSFKHLTLATGLTTLGFTAEISTPLGQHFALRSGINLFRYSTKTHTINLNDPHGLLHQAFGQDVTYVMRGEAKNMHGHIAIDYYPFKKGVLYISGGFYIGKTQLTASGIIANKDGSSAELQPPYEWPELEFKGQKLDITNGRLDAELTLGHTVKPYIGIGLGRAIPKRRLGIKVELGILFAGSYTIRQNGIQLDQTLTRENNFQKTDSYLNWFKYYPMAKFQLRYRIF